MCIYIKKSYCKELSSNYGDWQVQKSTEWTTAGDSGKPIFQSQSAGQFSLAQIFFFNSSRPSTDGMWPTYIVRQFAYSVSVSLNAIQKHPQRNTWNNHVPSQLKKKKICHRGNFSKDLQYSQDLLAERRVDHHILGELKWLGFSLKSVAGYGPKKRRRKSVELWKVTKLGIQNPVTAIHAPVCLSFVVWPWARHLPSLNFSFLIFKLPTPLVSVSN